MDKGNGTSALTRIAVWVLGAVVALLILSVIGGVLWEKTGAYIVDLRIDVSTSDANGSALISRKYVMGDDLTVGDYVFFSDESGTEMYGRVSEAITGEDKEARLTVQLPSGDEIVTSPVMLIAETEYSISYIGAVLHFVATPLGIICCVAVPLFILLVVEIIHLLRLPSSMKLQSDNEDEEEVDDIIVEKNGYAELPSESDNGTSMKDKRESESKRKSKKSPKEPAYMLIGMNQHKPEPLQAATSPLAITPARPDPARIQMPEMQALTQLEGAFAIEESQDMENRTDKRAEFVAEAPVFTAAPISSNDMYVGVEKSQSIEMEIQPQMPASSSSESRYDDPLSRWKAEFPSVANYTPTEYEAEAGFMKITSKPDMKSDSRFITGAAAAIVERASGEDAVLHPEDYVNEIHENVEPLSYVKTQPEKPLPDALDVTREYYISTSELAASPKFAAELYSNAANHFTIDGVSVDVEEACLRLALDEALRDREISITVTKDYTNVVVGDAKRGEEISFALLNERADENAKVVIRKSHKSLL